MNSIPNHIAYQGETYAHAGDGKTRGSHAFFSVRTGKTMELHDAVVVKTGPLFDLATVPANSALTSIRVEKTALHGKAVPPVVGTRLLVGPIDHAPAAGPRALAAWPYHTSIHKPVVLPSPRTPAKGRVVGVISRVAPSGASGRVLLDGSGTEVFVHSSQLRQGVALRRGLRVSCVVADAGRGLAAFDVRLAA